MVSVVAAATVFGVALLLLLARYATTPRSRRAARGADTLVALAAEVAHDDGSVGVIFTTGAIDRSGVAERANLELIDGHALLTVVEQHLPDLAAELQHGGVHDRVRVSAPMAQRPLTGAVR
jgi:hypothetical protein